MTDIPLSYQMALITLAKEAKVENVRESGIRALFYIRNLHKDSLIQGHLVRDLTEVSQ